MGEAAEKIDAKLTTVPMPIEVDSNTAEALSAQCDGWLLSGLKAIILDFKVTRRFSQNAYRPFLLLQQKLKKNGQQLFSLNVESSISRQFISNGLKGVFQEVESVDKVLALSGLAPTKQKGVGLDVGMINPFISATLKTLATQAQTEARPGKPFLVKIDDKAYPGPLAIAGVIHLASEKFEGTISILFTEKVFLAICSNMFGEKFEKITSELEDAAGELLNIIYGMAKTELNETQGANLRPALPTVLAGDGLRIRQRTMQKIIMLPFDTSFGQFHIEISMDAN